jgi:ankyrin repeat protein
VDNKAPVAVAAVNAIRTGDTSALAALLAQDAGLASEQIHGSRTPLLVAADWPGYFPNGPAIVRLLIEAGADPNADTGGDRPETPLHWAASSDDADVADALIAAGARLETPGGSIGTPLDNAIGYGCWNVARLLVQRGARVDKLWHAAALGIGPRLEELLGSAPAPTPDDITEAFWQACHGGQRRAAERLLASGADPDATPGYSDQSAIEVAAAPDTQRENLVTWLRGRTQAS